MTMPREDLREHLVAVIGAARELPHDSQEQLADVFLDEMHRHYDLVPRGSGARPAGTSIGSVSSWLQQMRGWPLLVGLVGVLLLLPLLLVAGFALFHLLPFAFPLLMFIFVFRPGMGRGRVHRHTWR